MECFWTFWSVDIEDEMELDKMRKRAFHHWYVADILTNS